MPKVLYGNVTIECATAEEAAQVARSLEDKGSAHESLSASPETAGHVGSRWTETRLNEFHKLIKGQQRKVLDTLLESPDGRTDTQLLQTLGWDNGRMLAGVLSGLAKNAKKAGVGGKELYTKHHVSVGDEMVSEYKLTDSFRNAVLKSRKQK